MKRWFSLALVALWCLAIYGMTASPVFTSKSTSGYISKTTGYSKNIVKTLDTIARKDAHFTVFGVLAFLVWNFVYPNRRSFVSSWFFTTFYAATDEWHQLYVPGRTAAVKDVIIDSAGAAFVLFVVFLWQQWRHKKLRE